MSDFRRPPRVTPEEHAAFKTEMQTLRHVVRKVRQHRLKYLGRHELPPLHRVQEWKKENTAAPERLAHWDEVLHSESTREIRAPVRRLWNSMNLVRGLAKLNEIELDYYAEQHARKAG